MTPTEPTAGQAAHALLATWRLLLGAMRGARVLPGGDGIVSLVTGAPVPALNGVWVATPRPDVAAVGRDLDTCRDSGVPFCLQTRPDPPAELVAEAERRGMRLAGEVPLMVRDGSLLSLPAVPGIAVRVLDPVEYGRHAEVLAPANGAPVEVVTAMMSAELLSLPGVTAYVGTVDGTDVVTAMTVRVGQAVGLFNVGTLPEARGRGYAEHLSGHAVADGLRSGAGWAFLQSSDMAVRVYERLGFRTREVWPMHVAGR